jgi:hypothetical protein
VISAVEHADQAIATAAHAVWGLGMPPHVRYQADFGNAGVAFDHGNIDLEKP